MRFGFIGGGVMGEAVASALINKGLAQSQEVCVADPSEARRDFLFQRYGLRVTPDNLDAAANPIVVLAVKPAQLNPVLAQLRGRLREDQLCLSIVAGATIDQIRLGLAHEAVVRAMPNTPAQIGQGMTVWTATPQVTEEQRHWAQRILAALGEEVEVSEEAYLDMATAISGSGPAYVFLFMEALIDASVHLGLPRPLAETLVRQTVAGSVALAQTSQKDLAELRHSVTSPGGTTAEAILVLEEGALRGVITKAAVAAHRKAQALGGSPTK